MEEIIWKSKNKYSYMGNVGYVFLNKSGKYKMECKVNGKTFITLFSPHIGKGIKSVEESRLKKGRPSDIGDVKVSSRKITNPNTCWELIDKQPIGRNAAIAKAIYETYGDKK